MREIEWVLDHIVPLLVLSLLHWILALMLLEDLKRRERILGGRKWPWAVVIASVAILGSVLYLVCHPGVLLDPNKKK